MKLIEDTANQVGKHVAKNLWWQKHDIEVERHPLPVGDYVLVNEAIQNMLDRKASRGIAVAKKDFLGAYKVCVDSKKDIQELVGDICGKQHDRFKDELMLAQTAGIQLYIVVENRGEYVDKAQTIFNDTIYSLEDLHSWKNPRLFLFRNGKQRFPTATKGITLQKACMTIEKKYGAKFLFCRPEQSAQLIYRLLTERNE